MTQIKELQERLEAKQAERRALKAQRAEAEEVARLETELAREEMMLRLDEELAKANEAYGANRVRAVVSDDPSVGFVIVKAPALPTFRKYQDANDSSSEAVTALVTPCLVYPDRDQFDRVMSAKPGMLIDVGNAVCELAGVRAEGVAKK